MAQCIICGHDLGFFYRIMKPHLKWCDICDKRLHDVQQHWMRTIERAFTSGGVSQRMEQDLRNTFRQLQMPPALGQIVLERLRYLRTLSEIRWGNVPVIRTSIHIDTDEIPHFEIAATYHKPNKQVRFIPGRLIGTNKKMYFISDTGSDGKKLDWNNVGKVSAFPYDQQLQSQAIQINTTRGSGGGYYSVADSLYTKTIIDTLVRLWKRQLVFYKEQNIHGKIPEHIKSAVYRRDGGRCVQCGYSGEYLEYDHVTPRSKGGPNTVENIQLLCRRCNLQKSDRI